MAPSPVALNPYALALAIDDLRRLDPQLERDQIKVLTTPGRGYGQVECLLCSNTTELDPNKALPDGGLANGIGSYRNFKASTPSKSFPPCAAKSKPSSTSSATPVPKSNPAAAGTSSSTTKADPKSALLSSDSDSDSDKGDPWSSSSHAKRRKAAALDSDADSDLEVVPKSASSIAPVKRPRTSHPDPVDPAAVAQLSKDLKEFAEAIVAGKINRIAVVQQRLDLKVRARALGVDWDKTFAPLFYPAGHAAGAVPSASQTPSTSMSATLARLQSATSAIPNRFSSSSSSSKSQSANKESWSSSPSSASSIPSSSGRYTSKEKYNALEAAKQRIREKLQRQKEEMQGIRRKSDIAPPPPAPPLYYERATPAAQAAAPTVPPASSAQSASLIPDMPMVRDPFASQGSWTYTTVKYEPPSALASRRPGPFVPSLNDYSAVEHDHGMPSNSTSLALQRQPSHGALAAVAASGRETKVGAPAVNTARPRAGGFSTAVRNMLLEAQLKRDQEAAQKRREIQMKEQHAREATMREAREYREALQRANQEIAPLADASTSQGKAASHADHLASLAEMAARRYWRPEEGIIDSTLDALSVTQLNMNRADPDEQNEEFRVRQQDIDEWFAPARQTTHHASVTVKHAARTLGLESHQSILPGFKYPLCEFQIVSVAWMGQQEESKLSGGINADEMGLGKTVQMLAVMASRRSKDKEICTNLVVVPLALIAQWENEIAKFVEGFKVHVYHGSKKAKTVEELTKYDVVLTTYNTLAGEWQDPAKEASGHGLLFKLCWYRIVIDEAHFIRNRMTKMSRACVELDGVFRWCLTGTPVINSLADYFALLKFLRIRPWTSDYVVKLEKSNLIEAGKRCNTIVDRMTIRRRKDDKLDGKPLVELLPKTVNIVHLRFTDDEEREAYDEVERQAQVKISKWLRQGTLLKNMSCIFVLILRLRQMCLHPSLIAVEGTSQLNKEDEYRKAETLLSPESIKRLLDERLRIAIAREAIEDFELEDPVDEECAVCFDPILPLSLGGEGVVTPCGHCFCRTCLIEILREVHRELDFGDMLGYQQDERPCPTCRTPFSEDKLIEIEAFEPDAHEVRLAISRKPKSPKKKAEEKAKSKHRAVIADSEEEEEEEEEAVLDDSSDDDDSDVKESPSRKARSASPSRRAQPAQLIVIDSDDEELPPPSALLAKLEVKPKVEKDVKPKLERETKADITPGARSARKPDIKPKVIDRKGKGKAKAESDDDYVFADVEIAQSARRTKVKAETWDMKPDIKPDVKPSTSLDWLKPKVKQDPFRSPERLRPGQVIFQPVAELDDNDDVIERSWYRAVGNKTIIPSTKMQYCFKQLKAWKEEDPAIKTIVVSSFVSGLEILDTYLRGRGIETVRYQGSSNAIERKEAIHRLDTDPNVRVMLLSMKAGGVGLNLTSACRVISLDLAWSGSTELQAFDRVHRLGQRRPVLIERIVIEDTIEARILSLQDRKMLLSDMSLAEGKAKNGLAGIKVPELLGVSWPSNWSTVRFEFSLTVVEDLGSSYFVSELMANDCRLTKVELLDKRGTAIRVPPPLKTKAILDAMKATWPGI
ncbi:BQ5605_C002g01645 [Microbotryum silenes-dioicae]|uniref:BQ5605_C002g01645 protein n=1 Tax=Microbotryum silenes-dioicae TaxID=796604 RepID=A0A2X0MLA5_9BASI|nr:BQ5605_C002g01645 [Microbotryum silenes-dioicae]